MSDALEINEKFLHPIKEAAELVSYSRDYITRLAREKKIIGTYIGRQWFVDLNSVRSYVESSSLEQEIRKKKLSDERKCENQIREAVKQQRTKNIKKAESLHARSLAVASLVLMFGLITGLSDYQLILFSNPTQLQVANIYETQEIRSPLTVTNGLKLNSHNVSEMGSDYVEFNQAQNLRSIGDIQTGILLFPDSDQASVAAMLSDKIVVKELSDGTQIVVRVDANGQEIGNAMPFVTVPIEHKKTKL